MIDTNTIEGEPVKATLYVPVDDLCPLPGHMDLRAVVSEFKSHKLRLTSPESVIQDALTAKHFELIARGHRYLVYNLTAPDHARYPNPASSAHIMELTGDPADVWTGENVPRGRVLILEV